MSSDGQVWQVHIDGAARGNPGPAAFAFVLERPGAATVEDKGCLGSTTNNQAEYTALVRALEKAAELGGQRLHVLSDSELLVKQMRGEYRVKNESLREHYQEAKQLCNRFQAVTFAHVPREQNRRADDLCNQALDGTGDSGERRSGSAVTPRRKVAVSPPQRASLQAEAAACLRVALEAWGRHDPHKPRAEDVWEQLWSVLEEHGIVAVPKA